VVVVVGGMGSVPGALLAAVVIGVVDAFGVLVLPRASLVMMFVVMAVILIVRPWGLLGRPPAHPRTAGGAIVTARALRMPRPWVAAVVVLLIAAPPILPTFHVWVLVEILAFALFAASLHLLMGTGGMVSFGHAASFGLGAYGAALLVTWTKAPMLLAFAAAPLAAAAGAALYGYFCVRLSSIYFAMLTLAFAQIAFAIVHQWYDVTGGDNGLLGIWPAAWLAGPLAYYYLALTACGGGLALLARIGRAPVGLTVRAARDHARRAQTVGTNIRLHQRSALGGVGMDQARGELLARMGLDAGGETESFDILAGLRRADDGAVAYRGEGILGLAPHAIWRRGVSRTFQVTATFATLSALENVQVA